MQTRIVFIGGGNMAEAIFAKLNTQTLNIIVVQRNHEKLTLLQSKYPAIRFISKLDFATQADDIVILAVKPQDAKLTSLELKPLIHTSTIVSIMAGTTTTALKTWLGCTTLVRLMSNTPATLGMAASGIYFATAIMLEHQQLILNIFSQIGQNYILESEDFIDKTTSVGASSVAYVYYFIESLIETAVKQFGFTEEIAKAMTLQVVKGSVAMIENNPDITIEQLRANVTSKKGTTDAALNVLDNANFKQIITQAELACYNRAKELGMLFN